LDDRRFNAHDPEGGVVERRLPILWLALVNLIARWLVAERAEDEPAVRVARRAQRMHCALESRAKLDPAPLRLHGLTRATSGRALGFSQRLGNRALYRLFDPRVNGLVLLTLRRRRQCRTVDL